MPGTGRRRVRSGADSGVGLRVESAGMTAQTVGGRAEVSLGDTECVLERNRARPDPCIVTGAEPASARG